jgi:hypothetical protein
VRDIFQEPSVSTAIDAARNRWQRAEDAWDALEWTMARDPEMGEALTESGNTRSLTLDGARSIDLPTVTAVYELENSRITVTAVQFEDSRYGESGTA